MENIRQKKKPWEEKKIFAPQMALKNAFKKRGYHLWKSNFKVQDTTKSIKQKRCVMIRLNVDFYRWTSHFFNVFSEAIFYFMLYIFEFVKFR